MISFYILFKRFFLKRKDLLDARVASTTKTFKKSKRMFVRAFVYLEFLK